MANLAYHYLVNHGRPDIHDLRCFVAVAERLSFTQAAKALCVSLPPLSRRIRDMENALKVRLFIRDTRRVELTGDGVRLVPIARHILSLFDELPRIAAERPMGNFARSVLYGVPPLLHPDVRKRLIDLEVRAAGTALTSMHLLSSEIITGVRRGELAFGLIRPPLGAPGLLGEAIHEEEMGAVLCKVRFGIDRPISVGELSRMSYVRPEGDLAAEFGRQTELQLDVAGVLEPVRASFDTASHSINDEGAFTIVPLSAFNSIDAYRPFNKVCRSIVGMDATLVTILVWRSDLPDSDPDLYDIVLAARSALAPVSA
ncbi:hypothetical protein BST43_11025 [Mycobacteroides saopaulense]|uniref:Probable hydrogen peroxide-inducible genes activator n=1 Tax=Mycobacteroides saopaulense TaxID=1578165 RepID=A0A1X0J754_9MYCO|nr:hypothetical protein BST43_11025 [Mycobacteroides saopaulense]